MTMINFYEIIKGVIEKRELQELGLKKGLKVKNRFLRYSEIAQAFNSKYTKYEIRLKIKQLERAGLISWSFYHKRYLVHE